MEFSITDDKTSEFEYYTQTSRIFTTYFLVLQRKVYTMLINLKSVSLLLLVSLAITACNSDSKNGADSKTAAKSTDMNETQQVSYTLGINIGMRIKASQKQTPGMEDFENEYFLSGLRDALEKKPDSFKLSNDQMVAVMKSYQQKMIQKRNQMLQKVKQDGIAFLEKKKNEQGIIADKSGILYKVLKQGSGKSPTEKDNVQVHYRGSLIDGKEFDSSYQQGKPVTLNLQHMISAWKIMIPKMKEGSRWTLYVPAKHAYGQHGIPPQIRPHETLVFNVELIKVNPQPEKASAIKPDAKTSAAKPETETATSAAKPETETADKNPDKKVLSN